YQYIQLMFDGNDTTINGYIYKTVTRREYADSTLNNSLPPVYSNKIANMHDTLVMAIREDNKRLMGIMFPGSGMPDTAEKILYDFNYVIGDTIKTAIHGYNCTITGSDSLLVGSVYHKRWITNCGAITEGIGHRWGLYILGNGQNICSLACFNRAGYGSYSPDSANCFYIHKYGTPTGVGDVGASETEIAVSPNPFTNEIVIKAQMSIEVRLYNAIGQLVLTNSGTDSKRLDTSTLPAGIYYVELVNRAMNIRKVVRVAK
ncbi:MAG: T9SS type A sorting domain-containing protein, partial [Taibaiella sp.]|nr:T9SS type A sorting domain-containing protein [Taibaiella sp.]